MARTVNCIKLGREAEGLDHRKYLAEQVEKHFFGEGADQIQGYVPPPA